MTLRFRFPCLPHVHSDVVVVVLVARARGHRIPIRAARFAGEAIPITGARGATWIGWHVPNLCDGVTAERFGSSLAIFNTRKILAPEVPVTEPIRSRVLAPIGIAASHGVHHGIAVALTVRCDVGTVASLLLARPVAVQSEIGGAVPVGARRRAGRLGGAVSLAELRGGGTPPTTTPHIRPPRGTGGGGGGRGGGRRGHRAERFLYA